MMAGKDSQSPVPLTNGTTYSRSDAEAQDSRELRRKKRIKYLLYFVAFVIFQTAVIAIFTLTIMKVRTPKFRMSSATFDSFNVNPGAGAGSPPSFDLRMNAQLSLKNANFGKYKYEDTTMYLLYKGAPVGEAAVPKSSVGWRSTKKINVVANLTSTSLQSDSQQLGDDLSSGVLRITSQAEMKGKVKLTFIFNKKKSTKMNCTMDIAIRTQQLTNISCQ